MIHKPIGQISKEDIDALIENEVAEMKTIEYKESLPTSTDKDKKEFLADVSSFANAAGGDILYGVKEKRDGNGQSTGIPEKADGIEGINADSEILRLESILRDGVEPRIQGVRFKAVTGFSKGPVIVLRIPKSWSSPHMVKNHWRFYSRYSNGKNPLDVSEIRAAFALSESVGEKIRRFRDERIARIVAGEMPVPLSSKTKTVLHVIPFSFSDLGKQIDITARPIRDLCSNAWTFRYNFDGLLGYHHLSDSPSPAYLQIFRTGVIEWVSSKLLRDGQIPIVGFEEKLISALRQYLKLEKQFNLNSPVIVILTLLGVKDFKMAVNPCKSNFEDGSLIDKDNLPLPDILVENLEVDAAKILRPVFDTLWQSCGWERSMHYDQNGDWTGGK